MSHSFTSAVLQSDYRSFLLKLLLCLVIFELLLHWLTSPFSAPSSLDRLLSYDERRRQHAANKISDWDPRLVEKWRKHLSTPTPVATKVELEVVTLAYETLPECPAIPPDLLGPIQIHIPRAFISSTNSTNQTTPSVYSNEHVVVDDPDLFEWPQIIDRLHDNVYAGHYRPSTCRARQKVAIIIPYRNRSVHLRIFINHMIPILKRQQRDFKIFVIEQQGLGKFNRGLLMNVGYVEALREYNWQCVVFHDVDMLPENDRNLYQCDKRTPIHLSAVVDKFNYSQPYSDYFGGIEAFPVDTFRNINGFSNLYWGWGGEDDDLLQRVKLHGYDVIQPSSSIARYKMIKHAQNEQLASNRRRILEKSIFLMEYDGLSSLTYNLKQTVKMPLLTHLLIEASPEDYSDKFPQIKLD